MGVFTLGFLLHCNLVGDLTRCIPGFSQWVGPGFSHWVRWAALGCCIFYAVTLPCSREVLAPLKAKGKSNKVWKSVGKYPLHYIVILLSNIVLKPLALVAVPFQILLAMFGFLSDRVDSCNWFFKLLGYWNLKSCTWYWNSSDATISGGKDMSFQRAMGSRSGKVMALCKREKELRIAKEKANAEHLAKQRAAKHSTATDFTTRTHSDATTEPPTPRLSKVSGTNQPPYRRKLLSPQFSKLCEKLGIR